MPIPLEDIDTENITVAALRDLGFAVIIWNPTELKGAPPAKVEERSIELGWDVIDCLKTEPDRETDEEDAE